MQNETVNTEWGNAEAEAMCCGLLWTLDLTQDALIVGTTPDPNRMLCSASRWHSNPVRSNFTQNYERQVAGGATALAVSCPVTSRRNLPQTHWARM